MELLLLQARALGAGGRTASEAPSRATEGASRRSGRADPVQPTAPTAGDHAEGAWGTEEEMSQGWEVGRQMVEEPRHRLESANPSVAA